MIVRSSSYLVACIILVIVLNPSSAAQSPTQRPDQPDAPARAPNSNPTYQQLRNLGLSGETVAVKDLVLTRDAGTFTFRSGTFHFLAPVASRVTGAVFIGEGTFSLHPPIAVEKSSLVLLTKEPGLTEEFNRLVLWFTDGTYDEVKSKSVATAGPGGGAGGALSENRDSLRKTLHWNLSARLLQDVLSPEPGGLFVAFIKGQKYSGRMLYIVDPHGVPRIEPKNTAGVDVAPEEVALLTYDEDKFGVWAAFHLSPEYAQGTATGTQKNALVHDERHNLEVRIEKSGMLHGVAAATVVAQSNGVRVVPFNLYGTLRVQSVTGAAGEPLDFIQEDKNDDPDFAVILPQPLAAGERFIVRTVYGGKDVVTSQGGGNYYPIARESWYPNTGTGFGDFASYEVRFRIPRGLKIVATGKRAREIDEGDENISDWSSEAPQAVAGFNVGHFKLQEAKLEKEGYLVESYANQEEPDIIKRVRGIRVETRIDPLTGGQESRVTPGSLPTVTTTSLMQKALAEGQIALQIYTDYFGPLPYHRLAMTQQTASTYGQAWPELVFLPITYFFDTTIRHAVGIDDPKGYFTIVGPHEVAHQWWGHTVGFHSYRDQWMSEGFSDFSASLFLQTTRPDMKDYHKFWNDEHELLLEKNRFGYRAIDVGPLTLGYRLSNTRTGGHITRRLIYPKGAYVLHMLRMMMWSPQTGDDQFKAMLKDFVQSYRNQPASTEDFKAMVEKHMLPEMNLTGDGKMDWFFDQYVYGTALPEYTFGYNFSNDATGTVILNISLQQSNVDDRFRMRVPIYLELANGRVVRLASANIFGNKKLEQSVPLRGVKDRPKRAMLNYYHDVLCTERK